MKINFQSSFNKLSYSVVGRNLLRQMYLHGHEIAVWPLGGKQEWETADDYHLFKKCEANQATFSHDAPSLLCWHEFELSGHRGKGRRIGFPIFEMNTFTDRVKNHLLYQTDIIVPSSWAKDVVTNQLGALASVVPLGTDPTIFFPAHHHNEIFSVLNIGKFEIRKGHDALWEVFKNALGHLKDTKLTLVPDNTSGHLYSNQEKIEWAKIYTDNLGDKVEIVPRLETQKDVAKVINRSNVYISLSRAEGWELSLLDSMACGVSTIGTFYSGHTEYLNDKNCRLINGEEKLELAVDDKFFHGTGEWLELTDGKIEQAIEHLRAEYKLWKEEGPQLNKEGLKTAGVFSWVNSYNKLMKVLEN